MQAAKFTKLDMATKMATSRSQLDRVLDPSSVCVQLDTQIKAAHALGKEIESRSSGLIKKRLNARRSQRGLANT
jgi:antitoxin HicB